MTEETQAPADGQAAAANQLTLNIPELVHLACNLLHGGFFAKGDEHGKKLFKDLKESEKLEAGTMTVGGKVPIKLQISLDKKEFRGQFGFPVFKAGLQAMLQNIGQTLNARGNLNFLTSETGNIMIHKPGVIEKAGEYNVLVLVLMPGKNQDMTLCLTYIDPDQYESLRKTKDSANTTEE